MNSWGCKGPMNTPPACSSCWDVFISVTLVSDNGLLKLHLINIHGVPGFLCVWVKFEIPELLWFVHEKSHIGLFIECLVPSWEQQFERWWNLQELGPRALSLKPPPLFFSWILSSSSCCGDILSHHRSGIKRQGLWTEISEAMKQNQPFSFKSFVLGILLHQWKKWLLQRMHPRATWALTSLWLPAVQAHSGFYTCSHICTTAGR